VRTGLERDKQVVSNEVQTDEDLVDWYFEELHKDQGYEIRETRVLGVNPYSTVNAPDSPARAREAANEAQTTKSVPALPAWVPLYPESKRSRVTLLAYSDSLYNGSYEFHSYTHTDNAILAFYAEKLVDADLLITKHPDYLTAQDKAGNHRISITAVNGSVLVKFSGR
jgi:hypothetical protein